MIAAQRQSGFAGYDLADELSAMQSFVQPLERAVLAGGSADKFPEINSQKSTIQCV